MVSLLPLFLLQTPAKVDLNDLLRRDSSFEMRRAQESGQIPEGPPGDVFRGYLASRFNRPEEASRLLRSYVALSPTPDQEAQAFAYELLVDSDARLGRYKDASEAALAAIKAVGSYVSPRRREELEDGAARNKILGNIPAQTAEIHPFEVKIQKDMAKLNRVPITVGDTTIDTVFDTGAQLSVFAKSQAALCGIKPLPGIVPVDSITGTKVQAQLADIPDLKFGASTFHHVIVLVMDDTDLTFGPYKISAIVGFPVIEALGRLEFGLNGILRAGYQSDKPSLNNLALRGLSPVVQANYRDVDLTFSIDTGGGTSHFTKSLIDRFPDITSLQKSTLTLGGAGGAKAFPTYRIPKVELKLGGQTVYVPNADVLAVAANEGVDRFYGNLGQDIFRQYHTMAIDFKRMSFELEGKPDANK